MCTYQVRKILSQEPVNCVTSGVLEAVMHFGMQ